MGIGNLEVKMFDRWFKSLSGLVRRDFARHVRNHNYDITPSGLLVSNVHIEGHLRLIDPTTRQWLSAENLWTIEGKNHGLDVILHGSSQVATWYIAPASGNVSVADTWTAANFAANATELTTQYSESTRVAYDEAAASSGVTTNAASPSRFTAASAPVTIWIAGLLSTSTKAGTSGVLLAASKYSAANTLPSIGSKLDIWWAINFNA